MKSNTFSPDVLEQKKLIEGKKIASFIIPDDESYKDEDSVGDTSPLKERDLKIESRNKSIMDLSNIDPAPVEHSNSISVPMEFKSERTPLKISEQ